MYFEPVSEAALALGFAVGTHFRRPRRRQLAFLSVGTGLGAGLVRPKGDDVAREVVDEVARRIALHVAPVAAVADVELIVLGGGIGANGDLLLEPVQARLAEWLPYPPRVEVSTLGDAAVLTGALAIGLRAALDNVFDRGSQRQISARS